MNSSPIILLIALVIVSIMSTSTSLAFTQVALPSRSRSISSSLSFSPTDIGGAATLLSLKYNGVSHAIGAKLPQVLADGSYVIMDPHKFFPDIKISKLRMQYAQVFGRLMILGASFLPHIGGNGEFHAEEIAVQLFLLSNSMKPIIRSIKLYNAISKSNCDSDEECVLEFEEMYEASLI